MRWKLFCYYSLHASVRWKVNILSEILCHRNQRRNFSLRLRSTLMSTSPLKKYALCLFLKCGGGFLRILDFFAKKIQFLHWNETDRFQRVLNIFKWFFVQNEAEDSCFVTQKFFTSFTSFLPHFFDNEGHVNFWNMSFCNFWRYFTWKK